MRTAGYLAAVATIGAIGVIVVSTGETIPEPVPVAFVKPSATEPEPSTLGLPPATSSGLPEHEPDERLRTWADGIAPADIAAELERIEKLDSPAERVARRRALLFSWTGRDLVAVTRWVGTLGPAHGLQQEGRAQIVEALLQCNPEQVVPALRESLPETTSRQLYGPYFRGWAEIDPAAAADMLARLGAGEPRDPRQWNDLLGQVSAQWMASAPEAALNWLKALPEGEGKSAAVLQAGYRWAEIDPDGAATYAARREDPRLIKVVAAKWAETAPAKAVEWARTLPEGTLRTEALEASLAIWAQTDPDAAAVRARGVDERSK